MLIVGVSAMTSLIVSGINAPHAIPELVIYKDVPVLMQVNPKELARELLTTKDFNCFSALMTKESHWKDAKNKSSSAAGVGQLIDDTYRNLGMKRSKSTVAQTVAALAYIGRRYGSGGPCAAWDFSKSHGFY